jgi:guanine deaminase
LSRNRILRAQILSCTAKPQGESGWFYLSDGVIVISDGIISQVGSFTDLKATIPADIPVEHFPDQLIIPGMIDLHVHYPQLEMIGAHGEQLLDWLNRYTFPTELKYRDKTYASEKAEWFLEQLLKQGTTTALVFATSSSESVDAFYEAAYARNLRMVTGKVLMDRNAPDQILDDAQGSYDASQALIERWQGKGRLGYAITPRFAPTSTEQQLELAGDLLKKYPSTYLHTHLAENRAECEWVSELFPAQRSYLDVYDHFGLVTDRSVFAHGIHLDKQDLERMHQCDATICHCPSSNLFLGSGLFPLKAIRETGVRVTLGTDVGAGTSLSQFTTQSDAYKVQQLQGASLGAMDALYLATLAGAEALHYQDKIGSIEVGKEADILRINLNATAILSERTKQSESIEDTLFSLMILGDDRAVAETYILGEPTRKSAITE